MDNEPDDSNVFSDCFEPRAESASFSDATMHPVQDREYEQMTTNTLSVTVCDPEKHSTFFETYLRYRVRTESSREEFGSGAHDVFRRYSDFLWLRDRLEETHPTFVIPPFPPKHSVSSFERFSGPFISARCAALQRFLRRVAEHQSLSNCSDLFNFLTLCDPDEWARYKQEFKSSSQLVSKIKDFVQASEPAAEFEGCLEKLDTCVEACESLASTSRRLMAEEESAVKELANYAGALSAWSQESGHVARLGNILYHMAQAFDATSQDLLPTTLCLQSNFIPDAFDIAAYAECVRRVLLRRDRLQGLIRDTNDSASKLEESMDRPSVVSRRVLMRTAEDERQQREDKLQQLRNRSGSLRNSLEGANTDLRNELDRWSHERVLLLRRTLLEFAGQRMAHFRRTKELWIQTQENVDQALSRS